MVLRTRGAVAALTLLLAGCIFVPLQQYRRGERNRAHVNAIRIGQTLAEVQRLMGPPERRNGRVRYDGISVEEWSYLTDAPRHTDTTITFVGGKVEEVRAVIACGEND